MLSPLAWICQWTGSQSFLFCGVVFVLFWWFVFALFGLLLKMTASWTMYRSFTSSLLWPSISRRPRVLIWKLMLLQCHRACWTTWRKPWRRWTEKNVLRFVGFVCCLVCLLFLCLLFVLFCVLFFRYHPGLWSLSLRQLSLLGPFMIIDAPCWLL